NVARQLAYPRGQRVNNQATYQIYLKARQVNKLMHSLGKNNLDLLGLDLNTVKNFFVNNLNKSSAKYLKTPSVIVTYNDMRTTGGHNLSSKISRVNSLQNYKHDYSADSKPQTSNPKPQTTDRSPQTSTPKPQTSNRTPQTSNPKPQTASSPTIRPRTEVVPAGARAQRGL
ncbi:MAG: hypothetical protein FWH59_04530, partial [Lentimicrobiaceae bacterium]|nr:hypothetical protein [Lentimicrobiaceae bacterium]